MTKDKIDALAQFINYIQEPVVITDSDNNIIYINRTFTQYYGYSEELTGKNINVIRNIDTENQEKINHIDFPFKIQNIKKKDSSIVNAIFMNSSIVIDDNKYILSIVKDITADYPLLENHKLSVVFESLSSLSGGIAHDFNNILTAIIGNLSIAKLNLKSVDENFEILSDIEDAASKGKEITDELLKISKRKRLNKTYVRIEDIINEIIKSINISNIKFELSFDNNISEIEVDCDQIKTAFDKVIINSIEAMPNGGTITVKTEQADSVLQQTDSFVKISISDTGTGISKGELYNAFYPYVSSKNKRKGLGLAIFYSIIKKHDGFVEADSSAGEGTSIRIYLPLQKK